MENTAANTQTNFVYDPLQRYFDAMLNAGFRLSDEVKTNVLEMAREN